MARSSGRMIRIDMLLAVLLSACSSLVLAADRHEELALQFDELTTTADRSPRIDAYIAAIEAASPGVKLDREGLKKMVLEVFNSNEYRAAKIRIYKELFTQPELEQLVEFVKLPAYRLLDSKRPEMTRKVGMALQPIMNQRIAEMMGSTPPR